MTTWTKEPPKDRGWYWLRYDKSRGGPWIFQHILIQNADRTALDEWYLCGDDCGRDARELAGEGMEWWPIPLLPPPTEQENEQ